jgi:Flp pilus assembly protein TadB
VVEAAAEARMGAASTSTPGRSKGPSVFVELTAIGCAALAGLLVVSRDDAARRLGRLLPDEHRSATAHSRPRAGEAGVGSPPSASGAGAGSSEPAEGRGGGRLRSAVSLLAGLACALVLGGPVGWVSGVLLAVGSWWFLARLEPRAARVRRARLVAELPIAVDLLAACLRGGGAWHDSVEAVADAVGGPLGAELSHVAARIRLGADPAAEWLALAHDPVLAPLGRAAARAASGGAPLAATLARLARDQRRVARVAAAQRARSAGVRAVAPLGLCFLPAFILLGIVPAIAGIASTVLLP